MGDGQTSGTLSSVRTCLKGPPVARQNSTAILTQETVRGVKMEIKFEIHTSNFLHAFMLEGKEHVCGLTLKTITKIQKKLHL